MSASADALRRPGAALAHKNAKIHTDIYTNGTGLYACARFSVNSQGRLVRDGNHPSGALLISSVTDEDGRQKLTFTNHFGEKLLERSVISSGNYADTYFVYDAHGRLRYMLSPRRLPKSALQIRTWSTTNSVIDALAYYYEYNALGTVTMKKLPGRESIIYLCDKDYQPVMSQDGNQRQRGAWSYTLCDALRRPCVQGETVLTAEQARNAAKSMPTVMPSSSAESFGYSWLHQFPVDPFPAESADVVTHYDNYNFLSALPTDVAKDMAFTSTREPLIIPLL